MLLQHVRTGAALASAPGVRAARPSPSPAAAPAAACPAPRSLPALLPVWALATRGLDAEAPR